MRLFFSYLPASTFSSARFKTECIVVPDGILAGRFSAWPTGIVLGVGAAGIEAVGVGAVGVGAAGVGAVGVGKGASGAVGIVDSFARPPFFKGPT